MPFRAFRQPPIHPRLTPWPSRPNPRLRCSNCWPFISRPGSIARSARSRSIGWPIPSRAAAAARARATRKARACRTVLTGLAEPPPAPDAAIASAREAARTAPTLEALRALLDKFDGCALRSTATQLVFADGNPKARVMFVGEAPGRDEDIEGLPFVGRSGKLLDRMIAAIGLDRSKAYIANVIPWRPPGNRTPTPQETQICLPFIQRQIELVNPDVLVTLGNPSTQTLLGTREGIMRTPRQMGRLRHRHADDPRAADLPSGLSVALAVLQADVVAGSARDREGAGCLRALLPLRPHDGPADAQQRLAAVHQPVEGARHFGRRGPESAWRVRAAACPRYRRRARPRRRRSRRTSAGSARAYARASHRGTDAGGRGRARPGSRLQASPATARSR